MTPLPEATAARQVAQEWIEKGVGRNLSTLVGPVGWTITVLA